MTKLRHARFCFAGLLAACLCPPLLGWAGEPAAVDFSRDVLPILQQNCFRCHEGREAKSGIRLDQRSVLLGLSGGTPLVAPGDSGNSRLWRAVSGADADFVMPPEGPRLKAKDVQVLKLWIDQGLSWDEKRLPDQSGGKHWAFLPVQRPAVPIQRGDAWCENPVDHFIARRHQRYRIEPAALALRRTLIRRLYLAMLGIPPGMEDMQRFAADRRPDAWRRLVDRVLASPHYGERWGRHWLDVARWAESEGYESNHPRPSAWRYRDYVVRSFHQDRPFDEFVRQQIAGDEMPEYSDENLIATGFLAAARISSNEEDKWLQRNDVNVDIVNAVGNALLGLTIGCAQCHDHKFDPLPTRDYYRLQAFFVRGQPTPVRLLGDGSKDASAIQSLLSRRRAIFARAQNAYMSAQLERFTPAERRAVKTPLSRRTMEQETLARRVEVQIQISNRRVEQSIQGDERKEYDRLGRQLKQHEREYHRGFVYFSPVTSPHRLDVLDAPGFYPLPFERAWFEQTRPYVMPRGDVHRLGEHVRPGWPGALDSQPSGRRSDAGAERSRLELAEWLTSRSNPLLARVWVNRIWNWHFGRGLVKTVNDFGLRGARPTHPQLLDWLACELIDSGWSTKHIQRLILSSRTWKLSTAASGQLRAKDPENDFYTRWTPRRLEAEVIRDSLLAVSGELDSRVGGRSVPLDDRESSRRRSLYLWQQRGRPEEMQGLFDGPNECSASLGHRLVSTSPLQSLYLLNHEFSVRRAEQLAAQLQRETYAGRDELIDMAWRGILQRRPTARERELSVNLLDSVADAGKGLSPLAFLCQSIMNLNEFVYLE